MVQNRNGFAQPVDLVPAVRYQQRRTREIVQQLAQLQLCLPAQIAVQSGEGLVQQQNRRLRQQNSSQRGPLLLPAGELGGPAPFQSLQTKAPQHVRSGGAGLRPAPTAQRRQHILFQRHIGK